MCSECLGYLSWNWWTGLLPWVSDIASVLVCNTRSMINSDESDTKEAVPTPKRAKANDIPDQTWLEKYDHSPVLMDKPHVVNVYR